MKKNQKNGNSVVLVLLALLLLIFGAPFLLKKGHESLIVKQFSNPQLRFFENEQGIEPRSADSQTIQSISPKKVITHRPITKLHHKKPKLQELAHKDIQAPNIEITDIQHSKNAEILAQDPKSKDEFQAGLSGLSLRKEPIPVQWDIRTGLSAGKFAFMGDIQFAPFKWQEAVLSTRAGVGVVSLNDQSTMALYLSEVLSVNTPLPTVTAYVGAGINYPLSSEASLGAGGFVGVEKELNVFNLPSEKVFLEVGYDSYSTGKTTQGISVMAGYKVAF